MADLVENSRGRLVIDQKPGKIAWFLGGFVIFWLYISIQTLRESDPIGGIFLAATALPLLFLSLVERQTLVFDATDRAFTITKRTVFGRKVKVFELGEVGRAKTTSVRGKDRRFKQVVLQAGGEEIIAARMLTKFKALQMMDQINGWLDSGPPKA
ncbi:hypothetical protein C8N43_3234 [Litoreibacter ponti]|uniref:PH (Pleckstrin Homology) domain-containing protein n=1 Tax=Litoreibacter ponti TaxID=1510457 RepID=A0A2T6BED1_9RHOB|nr:hypothetical protein [Litoreibacter ponti]PTX54420.1 hypothetical protein C8N43_3234 [Litoreibacter ponti]